MHDLINVFPNPTHDLVNFCFSGFPPFNMKAEVLDMDGNIQIIRNIDSQNPTLNLSGLPPSLYLIRLWEGHNVYMIKIFRY
ncbi:MAG: T9SS type A sorting domain-containing protein [Bacteroidota bacterium]